MTLSFFILLSLLFIKDTYSQQPSSCSCLSLKSGDTIIMGRNHDANLGNCLIVYNPKNIYKEGFEFPGENKPQWKSKYANFTFNVLGVRFAVCGMSEAGLAIWHTDLMKPNILKCIDTSEKCEITRRISHRKYTK